MATRAKKNTSVMVAWEDMIRVSLREFARHDPMAWSRFAMFCMRKTHAQIGNMLRPMADQCFDPMYDKTGNTCHKVNVDFKIREKPKTDDLGLVMELERKTRKA